jgi:hypothetical protein
VTASNQRSIVAQLALRRSKQAVDMSFQCSTCKSVMTDLAPIFYFILFKTLQTYS